jgi:hypothetical protein
VKTSPHWHIAMPSGGGIHSINQTPINCCPTLGVARELTARPTFRLYGL